MNFKKVVGGIGCRVHLGLLRIPSGASKLINMEIETTARDAIPNVSISSIQNSTALEGRV